MGVDISLLDTFTDYRRSRYAGRNSGAMILDEISAQSPAQQARLRLHGDARQFSTIPHASVKSTVR